MSPKTPHTQFLCCFQLYKLPLKTNRALTETVDLLIHLGANVTIKSKQGITALNVILRKTPSSIASIHQKFDESITSETGQEIEMRLDFRNIIQHCHPRETQYLKTFIDEGRRDILRHPLCQAFLHVKWEKVRKFYLLRVVFFMVRVVVLTLFVLALFGGCDEERDDREICRDGSGFGYFVRNNLDPGRLQWILLVITLVECYIQLHGMLGSNYSGDSQNFLEWFNISLIFGLLYFFKRQSPTSHYIGASVVLLSWYNLMSICGQLPAFGSHIEMFNTIQKQFFKLFSAFLFILIGFTLCFCIIFPRSKDFANPLIGFISILVMMIGEPLVNISDNLPGNQLLDYPLHFMFILFLFLITIVLMNLLVGIAVNDIKALKKTAQLSKLVRQIRLIYHIESVLIIEWFPYSARILSTGFQKMLRKFTLISPQNYRVVLCVRPLNPAENRLPKYIMDAAFKIAGRSNLSPSPSCNELNKRNWNDQRIEDFLTKINAKLKKIDALAKDVQDLKDIVRKYDGFSEHRERNT